MDKGLTIVMRLIVRTICLWGLLIAATSVWARSPLCFAASDDWLPYSSFSAPGGGLLVRIARAAFAAQGQDSSYVFPPWNRALTEARAGVLTGIVGAWYSEERERDFLYSQPIYKNEIVFIAFANQHIEYRQPADLRPYKIGAVRGNSFVTTLQSANLQVDLAKDMDENLRKFVRGRVKLIVDEKLSTEFAIAEKFPSIKQNVVFLQPPLETNYLYLIVSKEISDAAQIIADFNKGLAKIEQNGTLRRIYQDSGF